MGHQQQENDPVTKGENVTPKNRGNRMKGIIQGKLKRDRKSIHMDRSLLLAVS